jgi:hypothetical protein
MAKIKMAGKKNVAVHGSDPKVWNDYNNNPCHLASALALKYAYTS